MLSYEEFKEFSREEMKNYFPEGSVENVTYLKANMKIDGMEVSEDKESRIAGRFDLQALYQDYRSREMEGNASAEYEVIRRAVQNYYQENDARDYIQNRFGNGIDKTVLLNHLSFKLINTDQNQELLKSIPNRAYLDLSVTYISMVGQGMTVTINNSIMEHLGMTEKELYDVAYRNTKEQTRIYDLGEVMEEIMLRTESRNLLENDSGYDYSQGLQLFVITNSEKMNGAGCVLIRENLDFLADRLGDDLCIIPSSLHECIAISKSMMAAADVAAMVYQVNMEEVDIRDRLSNNVYSFTRGDDSLRMTDHVSDKKIDGTDLIKGQESQARNNPLIQGGAR